MVVLNNANTLYIFKQSKLVKSFQIGEILLLKVWLKFPEP